MYELGVGSTHLFISKVTVAPEPKMLPIPGLARNLLDFTGVIRDFCSILRRNMKAPTVLLQFRFFSKQHLLPQSSFAEPHLRQENSRRLSRQPTARTFFLVELVVNVKLSSPSRWNQSVHLTHAARSLPEELTVQQQSCCSLVTVCALPDLENSLKVTQKRLWTTPLFYRWWMRVFLVQQWCSEMQFDDLETHRTH